MRSKSIMVELFARAGLNEGRSNPKTIQNILAILSKQEAVTNAQIAATLDMSESAIKDYTGRVIAKLFPVYKTQSTTNHHPYARWRWNADTPDEFIKRMTQDIGELEFYLIAKLAELAALRGNHE